MEKANTAVEVFNKLAETYQEKYMDVQLYHDTFDLFCRRVEKPGAAILEIGCGPGNITRYLLTKRPDFNILGTDLAPRMIELARKNNPGAVFQVWDGRKITCLNQQFDAVLVGFCLPYLTPQEVETLVQDTAHILTPQGVFYLSGMEGNPAQSGLQTSSAGDQVNLHFYEIDWLVQRLTKSGFEHLAIFRKSAPVHSSLQTTDFFIICQKGNPAPA
ncbi:MAG: class I SAM-dependent methyltransferase [Blastocatellia bacterium]|nr:class I SAM-dependent methyltransferase [Blastocatellia bacterium]